MVRIFAVDISSYSPDLQYWNVNAFSYIMVHVLCMCCVVYVIQLLLTKVWVQEHNIIAFNNGQRRPTENKMLILGTMIIKFINTGHAVLVARIHRYQYHRTCE